VARDLVLAVADTYDVASESLGVLREHLGQALGLADKAINTGIARVVAAARTGNNSAYMAAARRANALINTAHAAARRYGFSACARW